MLPALTQKLRTCNTRVDSCGEQPSNGISCHRFYKCIDNVAYSCQNPKVFQAKCSGKYWNWRGKADYICLTKAKASEMTMTKDPTEQDIADLRSTVNELMCSPDRTI